MTYNTGNAIGSADARDLYDNAQNLDKAMNSTDPTWIDRFGVARPTFKGAESELNQKVDDAEAAATQALGYLNTMRATSYGPLAEDPTTDPLGNPCTAGDEYFNTTYNLLKRFDGSIWRVPDINTENLASGAGSSMVGHGGQTVEAALNERLPEIGNYALLRAYAGPVTAFFVRGVANILDGGAGVFRVDAGDTTTADNGGTVLVDASGRRWKREFVGAVHVKWFGPDITGYLDSYLAISAAVSATPTGGTLIIDGYYRCRTTITITRSMTIAGYDHRTGNLTSGYNSQSCIYFDVALVAGFDVVGCIVTFDGVVIAGNSGANATQNGIRSRDPNNSVILSGGTLINGQFTTGLRMTQGYYNKIENATIDGAITCLVADNVYNLTATALTIRAAYDGIADSYGISLLNGSTMTMVGGSIERFKTRGVFASTNTRLAMFGTYFEGLGGWNVGLGNNSSVTAIACYVYLTTGANRFITVESGTVGLGARVFARNNKFIYPTDATSVSVYVPVVNDQTCYWDICGDNWAADAGVNVTYTPTGWHGGKGIVRISYPYGHPLYGKDINTTLATAETLRDVELASPKASTQAFFACAGFPFDDPIGLRTKTWGANPYAAIYQNGQWEKVGLRMANQVDSTATDVATLKTDFNALLSKLRAAGVMV